MKKQHVDSNRRADRTVLSHSIMGLENGEKHKEHRKQITPHFSKDAVTESMQSLAEVANLYLDAWRHEEYRYGSLKSDIHHWSANSIGIFLCGKSWGEDKSLPEYLQALAKIEEVISIRSFHPFFVRWLFPEKSREVRIAYDYLYRYFERIIADRKVARDMQKPPEDMLETLIDLSLAKGENSRFWSYADIVEELISLTAGGTDAMSYTMAQALYLLSRYPEIQARAYAEALNVDPFDESCLNPFDDMEYTHNVIRETIRLYPAVPFSSKFFRDRSISIHGVSIPSRTNILWMKTAIGLNESFYKKATEFNPSRYDDVEGLKKESIESMMPFGGGIRHCVGSHLAESLCTRLLASILKEFKLEPISEVNVTYNALVSVTPSMVPVTLRPRTPVAQQLVT
jgi:cytochrome P450